jgi:hypothetical protein
MTDSAYNGLTAEDVPFGVEVPEGMPASAAVVSEHDPIPAALDVMPPGPFLAGYSQPDADATGMAAASPFQGGQTRSPATS